jgi:hypothetical protein
VQRHSFACETTPQPTLTRLLSSRGSAHGKPPTTPIPRASASPTARDVVPDGGHPSARAERNATTLCPPCARRRETVSAEGGTAGGRAARSELRPRRVSWAARPWSNQPGNGASSPSFEAIAKAQEERRDQLTNDDVAELTGLEPEDVERGLLALIEATPPYIDGAHAAAGDELCYLVAIRLLERGRREVRHWPPDSATVFIEELRHRIEISPDPVERSRLQKLLDAALSVSREVLGEVLGAIATKSMPL